VPAAARILFGMTRFLTIFVLFGYGLNSFGEVGGLSIKNAHLVAEGQGKVYRGSEPLGKENELARLGVTDVLIFKNPTGTEVSQEVKNLKAAGFLPQNIHQVSFEWKKSANESSQCTKLMDALDILSKVYQTTGKSIFFHCTVGEDRTGMLAGLFRMIVQRSSVKDIFQSEMCGRGYEAGNSRKPKNVVEEIRGGLTPLFLRFAYLIDKGELNLQRIDPRICSKISQIKINSANWVCAPRK
jgi:hypothetical protein